jgi:non-ribosomal peptide synthetase component F
MSEHQQRALYPASLAQQAMWISEKNRHMQDAYHLSYAVAFDGSLRESEMVAACDAAVSRHTILMSAFAEQDSVLQCQRSQRIPEATVADLSNLPPGQLERELEDQIRYNTEHSFDLDNGPLLRMILFKLARSRHVLLIVAHHLIFDGLSVDLLVRDILAIYGPAQRGDGTELTNTRPFSEYAAQQERRIAETLPAARRFWRDRWQEPDEMILPGLKAPVTAVDDGGYVEFVIDARQRSELSQTCRDLGITEFEFLLSSMSALLHRYGNKSPAITIALGLRPPEFQSSVGPFAQELPVVAAVERDMTFSQLAMSLRKDLRELYQYREVPLNRAITGVRPAAMHTAISLSYRPSTPMLELPGLRARVKRMRNSSVRGAVWAFVHAEDAGLRFIMKYSLEAIPRRHAEQIGHHWRNVIRHVTSAPHARLSSFSFLTDSERHQLLAPWPDAAADGARETLFDLFSAQAAERPGAVAVRCGTAQLTYAQLSAAASGLAQRIRCRGADRGSIIAVCAEQPADMLVGLLGVIAHGSAYVLVSQETLRSNEAGYLREKLSLVLTGGTGRDRADLQGLETEAIVARGCVCGGCGTSTSRNPLAEDLACLVAQPGGRLTAFGHRALAGRLLAFREILAAKRGDVWLALSRPASPAFALDLFLPLTAGAQVVFPATEEAGDTGRTLDLIRRHGITRMQATPSVWEALLDGGFDAPDMVALSGGETLHTSLARRLRDSVRRLFNAYAEGGAAIWSTCAEIRPDAKSIGIGRPVPDDHVYLMGEAGQLVPIGSAGEMCIAGHGTALGYPGRPATTAERFLPNPFGPPGSRLCRTGDRARYGDDGVLEFLGSMDRRVKLGPRHVELEMVEARLDAHPAVARCAVAAHGADDGQRSLVAYLVTPTGGRPSHAELDAWLAVRPNRCRCATSSSTPSRSAPTEPWTGPGWRNPRLPARHNSQRQTRRRPATTTWRRSRRSGETCSGLRLSMPEKTFLTTA